MYVQYNPYAWNKTPAMTFVDQPFGVGFSYSDNGDTVPDNFFTSAANMHIFLQTFISRFSLSISRGRLLLLGRVIL